jgi:hypothetical protein
VFDLTYQEKKSIVTLVSTILIFAAYCLYMYPKYPEQGAVLSEVLHYWGSFVLILMVVSIVAHIVISIVFNMIFRMTTGEKEPRFADELDRVIELRAHRTSFLLFILGFLCAMGSLVMEQPLYVMFDLLIASGFLADVSGSITKLYHYRRGI